MKIKLIIILLCILCSTAGFAQQYGWMNISSKLPDFERDTIIINNGTDTLVAMIRCMYFLNDEEGWIVFHTGIDTSYIYHTTDGADNWELRSKHKTEFNDIHMLDKNTGFAGGQDGGIIYKTTDGGNTWKFHWSLGNTLSEIEFPPAPADTGYACGMNGQVMMITPNGGTLINVNVNSDLHGLSFPVNSSEGWLSGSNIVRHCVNGKWYADQVHITGWHGDIHFISNKEGWTCGDRIMHTTDGINWNNQLEKDQLEGDLFSISFANNEIGCAVGTVGQVFFTTNGGNRWEKLNLGTNEYLIDVQMTSATCGYITGQGKQIFKYSSVNSHKKLNLPDIEIYPNPAKGKIKFHLPSNVSGFYDGFECIELIDINGKVLKS